MSSWVIVLCFGMLATSSVMSNISIMLINKRMSKLEARVRRLELINRIMNGGK